MLVKRLTLSLTPRPPRPFSPLPYSHLVSPCSPLPFLTLPFLLLLLDRTHSFPCVFLDPFSYTFLHFPLFTSPSLQTSPFFTFTSYTSSSCSSIRPLMSLPSPTFTSLVYLLPSLPPLIFPSQRPPTTVQ